MKSTRQPPTTYETLQELLSSSCLFHCQASRLPHLLLDFCMVIWTAEPLRELQARHWFLGFRAANWMLLDCAVVIWNAKPLMALWLTDSFLDFCTVVVLVELQLLDLFSDFRAVIWTVAVSIPAWSPLDFHVVNGTDLNCHVVIWTAGPKLAQGALWAVILELRGS